jgi:hypothetical protein
VLKAKVVYRICEISQGLYELMQEKVTLAKLSRFNFCGVIESVVGVLGYSSNRIGFLVRLIYTTYLVPCPIVRRRCVDRLVDKLGIQV